MFLHLHHSPPVHWLLNLVPLVVSTQVIKEDKQEKDCDVVF